MLIQRERDLLVSGSESKHRVVLQCLKPTDLL
jgi:hypothetical protein